MLRLPAELRERPPTTRLSPKKSAVGQEALLRHHRALENGEQIQSPRAFVATLTTRLAIDVLRSARVRRERYVGEWLPEPIITDSRDA